MHDDEIRFDVVIGFDAEDRNALLAQIDAEIRCVYPQYQIYITMDSDMSD